MSMIYLFNGMSIMHRLFMSEILYKSSKSTSWLGKRQRKVLVTPIAGKFMANKANTLLAVTFAPEEDKILVRT